LLSIDACLLIVQQEIEKTHNEDSQIALLTNGCISFNGSKKKPHEPWG